MAQESDCSFEKCDEKKDTRSFGDTDTETPVLSPGKHRFVSCAGFLSFAVCIHLYHILHANL